MPLSASNDTLALQAIAQAERQIELEARLLGKAKDKDMGARTIRLVVVDAGHERPAVTNAARLSILASNRKELPVNDCCHQSRGDLEHQEQAIKPNARITAA
jgi:hypothetical protein